jgi:hypothetical protein
MAGTAELNMTHDLDGKNSIELEETQSPDQPLDNTIILSHQMGKTAVEGEFDTTTGEKTAIVDYAIDSNTDVEVEHSNKGNNTIEVNVKI